MILFIRMITSVTIGSNDSIHSNDSLSFGHSIWFSTLSHLLPLEPIVTNRIE
jgi:hypothetical protein